MATKYHTTTTLNEIRSHNPCTDIWQKLLKNLGKTKADDEPLELLTILESNGLDEALWCLRVPSLERLSRHFQAWCAEQVLHIFESKYPNDTRVRDQIAMLRNDDATNDERAVARIAARDASQAVARAVAWDASRAAAQDAAWAAAWAASRDTARAAAWSAAQAVAWDAARAARAAQEDQLRKMIGELKG